MAGKIFEIAFQLAGKVNSSFGASFQNANDRLLQMNQAAASSRNSLRQLDAALRSGQISTDEYTSEQSRLTTELEEVERAQRSLTRATEQHGQVSRANSRLTNAGHPQGESPEPAGSQGLAVGGVAAGLGGAGAAVAGIGVAAIAAGVAVGGLAVNISNDLQKSLNGVQSATGTADEQMGGMRDTMLNIYNSNFGENFSDIGAAMTTVRQQTGLAGDALAEVTKDGLTLRDTFEMEVSESVKAANQIMRQFGGDSDSAFSLIAQGARSGLDANGDLLDTLNEYSGTFAAQGFNAEEMFNMLSNASKSGIRDVDLAADAIKEFGIRSIDGSTTSAAGFEALGLNAGEMTKSFASGGDAAKEAFSKTTTALLAMENPVEQNAAGVALFGTQFEDLGIKGIAALVNTKGAIDDTVDALDEINAVKYNTPGEAIAGIGRNLQTGILLPLGDKILPILNQFAGWITTNMPAIQNEISYAMDVASGVFNSISEVINTNVMPIFNQLSGFITSNMPQIKGAIQAMYDYVEPSFSRLGQVIQSDLVPMIQSLWGLVESAMPTIKVIFEVALGIVTAVLGTAVDMVATFIEVVVGIYDFIKPGLDLVIDIFNGVAGAIQWAIDKLDIFNDTPAEDKTIDISGNTTSEGMRLARNIGNNADGTDNWRGGLTWVGEKGPELLNLPGGSQIIPNNSAISLLGARGGSVSDSGGSQGDKNEFTFHFDIHGGNKEEIEPLLEKAKSEIEAIVERLMDQRDQGKRRVSYVS